MTNISAKQKVVTKYKKQQDFYSKECFCGKIQMCIVIALTAGIV